MIKYKKEEILQIVTTLIRANDVISKVLKSNPAGVIDTLIQSQEAAILLGTFIEENFKEKCAYLIELIENYCENLYQMSIRIWDESICQKLYEEIKVQLVQLRDGIQADIPNDRKEIVFLPYKASMWDSLESVWKVANGDENADVYVIPIPYFDKNPDGTFKEEYYEGDLYPKYVPITKYDEYDFEKRKPDMIYIHNPYDEYNAVTSVHPFFYSKNLKKFTEKLIYIPYFILEEINPNDKEAVNNMKHFCTTPGVFNADKVIVQSEDMREIYINVLTEISGNTMEVRKYWEEKIDGSGSPKIDKVLNTKKEELEIPKEWLKIIQKPDGSWKRIIFYNTSIGALLESNEQMLEKIESVFETFKKNKEKVALLWRPHPLIESTLTSMRPQLWEKYKNIRDKYIDEGWGIYDDTADMDRAVVLSDMYYGDRSSILNLCRKCNKKIMIQDCLHINHEEELNNFIIWDLIEIEDKVYFLHPQLNALFEMDSKNYIINKIHKNITDYSRLGAYGMLLHKDNKIYMLPRFANSIEIFDRNTNDMRIIRIPIGESGYLVTQFQKAIEEQGYIYMIPKEYPGIIKINISNDEIKIYNGWVKDKKEEILDGLLINDSIVFLTSSQIIFINKNSGITDEIIELENIKILKIVQRKDTIFGISCKGSLFEVNKQSRKIILKSNLSSQIQFQEIEVFNDENNMWVIDKLKGVIFELDYEGKIKEEIFIYGNKEKDIYPINRCIIKRIRNKIYISSLQKYKVFVFEIDKKKISELKINMSEECWKYLWRECDDFDTENEFPQFYLEKRIL